MLHIISTNIFELLKLSVPSIFAIILFLLASRKNSSETHNSQLKVRAEELYIPFYKFCVTHSLGYKELGDLSRKYQDELIEFLLNNIHLMDTRCQSMFIQAYHSYYNSFKPDEFNYDVVATMNLDFSDFMDTMQTDYTHICRKLKLPKPISLFLPYH